jgi:hypothetical protein
MPQVKSAKQKPNDACACGSGKKHKKCCGAGGGGSANALQADRQKLEPLLQSAQAASASADWASTLRRCERALRFAGGWLCAAGAQRSSAAAQCVLGDVLQLLLLAASAHMHQNEHAAADDCIARARVVATAPASFWARSLTSLTHASWRTERLEDDVRLMLLAPPSVLRHTLGHTAHMYGQHGRFAEGVATYDEALEVLAHEEPGQARDLQHSWLCDNKSCLLTSLARRAPDEPQRACSRRTWPPSARWTRRSARAPPALALRSWPCGARTWTRSGCTAGCRAWALRCARRTTWIPRPPRWSARGRSSPGRPQT